MGASGRSAWFCLGGRGPAFPRELLGRPGFGGMGTHTPGRGKVTYDPRRERLWCALL